MADVIVKILQAADSINLMTPDQARMYMQLTAGEATASDEFLNELIVTNSDYIARRCNRVFARERVRETWRCLGEPCDCADAASSRRMFLSHFPVKEEDIESVEIPRGFAVARDCWELDEQAGRISVYCGTSEPIVITYTGGYELPEDAPPSLRRAIQLLVSTSRSAAAKEASSISALGVRMIAHKSARIMFNPPSITESTSTTGRGGEPMSPAMAAVDSILSSFTRYWI
jgi:hypothetical protein